MSKSAADDPRFKMLDRGDGTFHIAVGLVADAVSAAIRDQSSPIASMLRVDARELCGVP
jgi:hypothetical protein